MPLPGTRQQKAWFFQVVSPAVRLLTYNKPNQATYQNLVSSAAFILNSEDTADAAQTQQGLVLKALPTDILNATDMKSLGFGSLAISVSPAQLPIVAATGMTVVVTQGGGAGPLTYTLPEYLISNQQDVTLTGLTTGQTLVWNGTKWVNYNRYYQGVDINLSPLPQEPIINFCPTFSGVDDPGNTCTTICIATNGITYGLMQQASTVTLLGNPTGGTANVQEITLGTGLQFVGSVLSVPLTVFWSTTGNTGTNPSTNWLGTNDGQPLAFKVNGNYAGWIDYSSPGNTFFGYQSGNIGVTSGTDNVGFGVSSLYANTSGSDNAAFGNGALEVNTSGTENTAIGNGSLGSNTSGTNNTGIGLDALSGGTTGNNNTALGYQAGVSNSGSNNTFLGSTTNTSGSPSNSTAIGYGAVIDTANTIKFGNASITNVILGAGALTIPVQYHIPLTGDTVTSNGAQKLELNPAGTLATLTIVFPASPLDGQLFSINSSQIVTAVTVAASMQTSLTALAAGVSKKYYWSANQNQWNND